MLISVHSKLLWRMARSGRIGDHKCPISNFQEMSTERLNSKLANRTPRLEVRGGRGRYVSAWDVRRVSHCGWSESEWDVRSVSQWSRSVSECDTRGGSRICCSRLGLAGELTRPTSVAKSFPSQAWDFIPSSSFPSRSREWELAVDMLFG